MKTAVRFLAAGLGLAAGFGFVSGCNWATPKKPAAPPTNPGASVPWTRYEAEEGQGSVRAAPATRTYLTPGSEATGRRYIRLEKIGDYVEFTVAKPGNGLVLRYGLPDSADGQGLDATLGLYINGQLQRKLPLTSRYAWSYGDFPWTNNPAAGRGHHFWDETQAVIPGVKPGDVIRLQKDADDSAEYYLVDFIELEQVPPALSPPTNSLSLVEFGAVPDDEGNDDNAMITAMDAAKAQGKVLWIPAGTFILDGGVKGIGGVAIQGAGIWHSRLTGNAPKFHGHGERIQVADLAIFGEVDHRDDNFPDNAFTGNLGENSEITRVWIEHMKCGVWSTSGTKNLRITGCRIRNMMADGVNLFDGTSDSQVEQCHLRNTGDDALASWSPSGSWSSMKPCERNRFIHNTVETPWHANGVGLYGGNDHEVRGNLVEDTVQSGGGLLISSGHGAIPFAGTIRIENNKFIRTGGDCYIDGRNGGMWIHAHESDIAAPLIFRNLTILDSANAGITIHGPRAVRDATFEQVVVLSGVQPDILIVSGAEPANLKAEGLRIERP